MIDPRQHFAHLLQHMRLGQRRAVDHDDRQAKRARGVQLCPRAVSTGIFRDDQVDSVCAHQCKIALPREGAAIDDQMVARQRRRCVRRIDEAQQIMMLWLGREGRDMHPAKRQHDATGRPVQRLHGGRNVADMGPAVALSRLPCWAGQHGMADIRQPRGFHRMGAHGGGKGVGRVDQMRNALSLQIGGKASDAAKAANTHRNRLGARVVGAPGIAQHRAIAPFGQRLGKRACLRGAAKDQDVAHGG